MVQAGLERIPAVAVAVVVVVAVCWFQERSIGPELHKKRHVLHQ